jgi:molybdopterin biosynthesis enzyme
MLGAMGARVTAEPIALAEPVKLNRTMAYFLPVRVQYDGLGHAVAAPRPPNGPGDFLALTAADGFVELPPQAEPYSPGFVATLYRW